jgi:hypothetical protein
MTGVDHDAVKCDTLFSQRKGEFKMLGIGGMVKVDGYRH